MNQVVAELLKGNSPTQIATITGFKRADVLGYIEEWKQVVRSDSGARERAKEAISGADQHYAMLIKEAWKTVDDADQAGQLNVKATALKLIADIESKRIGMLQEVGLLDNVELANQVAETERKQEILIGILKDVSAEHPQIRREIMRRLAQITGVVEPVEIVENASGS
ncbi:hypothetical protein FJZ33_05485 [Candidatus Poribacteria bacterium]|nr:hypothetical protein [Candidatus Poribacteria bacterium]